MVAARGHRVAAPQARHGGGMAWDGRPGPDLAAHLASCDDTERASKRPGLGGQGRAREDRRVVGHGETGARMRVRVLGAFAVTRGNDAVPVPGARARGLLTRLALAGGGPVEAGV